MPATSHVRINLLSKETLAQSAETRIVNWALTYGRYIMIGTEIIVLLAFISRFSLDRKRTDLREEIQQKQAILLANLPFENDIRKTQELLKNIKGILENQSQPFTILKVLTTILPPDVYYKSVEVTSNKVSVQAIAGTSDGFAQFLANILSVKQLTNVEISDVAKSPTLGITFAFSAQIVTKK